MLESLNDLPVVSGASYAFDEDDYYPGGRAIPLVASDAETGMMLDSNPKLESNPKQDSNSDPNPDLSMMFDLNVCP